MVTSAQLRAARALLNWTVRGLAEKAGVHRDEVTRAETDATTPSHAVARMVRTFEAARVEFLNGDQPGVRMKSAPPVVSDEAALPQIPETDGEPYDGAPI
jgi:transcriptional regulator with XRE-family HTH domain